jgi:hypothetical protein
VAALEVRLTPEEVAEIEAAVPTHAIAGDRYNEGGMKTIQK